MRNELYATHIKIVRYGTETIIYPIFKNLGFDTTKYKRF